MKEIVRSKIFWIGLLAKLCVLPFFGSSHLRELFIPFLDSFVRDPAQNPWSVWPPHYFPYGSVLLLALFVPRWLAFQLLGENALGQTALSLVLMKIPLLAMDVALLFFLVRMAPRNARRVLLYYWLSPVVFYINYLHGQLDVGSMMFCLGSLYFFLGERWVRSAIFMALATLCKFHVVLLIPVMLSYLWHRKFIAQSTRISLLWLAIWLGLSGLGFLPLIFAHRFVYASAGSPEAMRIFAVQLQLAPQLVLYVGIGMVLLVLGRLCIAEDLTELGLLFGCAILMGLLLLVTNPAPGWYCWFMPFVSLFYALYTTAPRSLLAANAFFYLAYFVYFGELQPQASIFFTLLQTSLAGILLSIWFIAIRHEAKLGARLRPFMIGIAGDSGAGKNTLAAELSGIFNSPWTVFIEGDDYHRWERGHGKWQEFTHLDPHANHLASLVGHMDMLMRGRPVYQPHYDHASGRFTEPREILPGRTMIVQGLHTFFHRRMRAHFDLKIFVAPDELVRLSWKIKRDVGERQQDAGAVLSSMAAREEDARLHIAPQSEFADWIVKVQSAQPVTREEILAGSTPQITVRHLFWKDVAIAELVTALKSHTDCAVALSDAGDRVQLAVDGSISSEQVALIAEQLFPNLRSLTRGLRPPRWQAQWAGLNQLIALALLAPVA